MSKHKIVFIKGDGIGPEISNAVEKILYEAGAPIEWIYADAGMSALHKHGNPLPKATLDAIKKFSIALKAPTETPIGGGHKSVNVTIRKNLDLYANVRPVKSLPGVETPFKNVDMILVRENVEDTYGGIENFQTPNVSQCLKIITRPGSLKVCRYAFEIARSQNRKKVTCVHKANIHKMSDGLFLECFRQVALDYPDIQAEDALVDNASMQFVKNPERFDVLVKPNLYGDILSDIAAGLVGGLGVAPGANMGDNIAVFEAVHGSAPDIAAKNLANPTALLLSAIAMLRHIFEFLIADKIERALKQTLQDGIKTRDLGGSASTSEFTSEILQRLDHNTLQHQDPHKVLKIKVDSDEVLASKVKDTKLVGVDVYIQHQGLPPISNKIGKFKLHTISNRGTKVYPGEMPDILLVDWHHCRFLSDSEIHESDIFELLDEISKNFKWIHIEKIFEFDGKPAFSKSQGE
jgi:isocitrate dehydrogenase